MRTDCREYRVVAPCRPHKHSGARCDQCAAYDPIAERILIVKLDALGDVLRTTSCLTPLKARYPRSHVTWLTRGGAIPLLDGHPAIDRVLSVDTNYLELLMAEEFDLAIGPDADPLSASIVRLTRSAHKQGFIADGRGGVLPLNDAAEAWMALGLDDEAKRANRRTYGEWLYGICELPLPVSRPIVHVAPEVLDRTARRLEALGPGVQRWVAFNTGASGRWAEKRWKTAHYRELARIVGTKEPETGILLVGGPGEAAVHRELAGVHPAVIDAGTGAAFDEFAALIAACDWVLTSDSLGYHVACAVGTPAVCLVGPTSPWELDRFGVNTVMHAPFDCIACYRPTCPFDRTCMDALTPEVVWAGIRAWRSAAQARTAEAEPAGRPSPLPMVWLPVVWESGAPREHPRAR